VQLLSQASWTNTRDKICQQREINRSRAILFNRKRLYSQATNKAPTACSPIGTK
jgi:hypothetical protein